MIYGHIHGKHHNVVTKNKLFSVNSFESEIVREWDSKGSVRKEWHRKVFVPKWAIPKRSLSKLLKRFPIYYNQ